MAGGQSGGQSIKPIDITDQDIYWTAELLGLPLDAFHGVDKTDPRQDVIKSLQSVDITACPGSGKTTLLIAKLVILSEHWSSRSCGICVLSHTNAARDEIESSLGHTAAGQRLLNYPHFVGTIHQFVNEFLALPALRSSGITGTQFNTEIAGTRIWKLSEYGSRLPKYLFSKIRDSEMRKAAVLNTHYVGKDFDLRLGTVALRSRSNSPAYQTIKGWKRRVLREGFASFDDTFAFGHWALTEHQYLSSALRDRFPLVFIDEAQDNSEEQSGILHRIFVEGRSTTILQRFGDENQAIYDSLGSEGAQTHRFPSSLKKDLPSSPRFGQEIADLASNLGVVPHTSGLVGCGPKESLESGQKASNTIFLFGNESATKVIEAYCQLLLRTFSTNELERGVFTAVGAIHNRSTVDEEHKYPHYVGHFWPEYDPQWTKREPQPKYLIEQIVIGLRRAAEAGESHQYVEKIAEGLLSLVRMTTGTQSLSRRRNSHRHLLELLAENPEMRNRYNRVAAALLIKADCLTRSNWNTKLRPLMKEIAESVVGRPLNSDDVEEFLSWKDIVPAEVEESASPKRLNNIFSYPANSPRVSIRVGSIHSVKGQTHTATLVLETFWRKHNLEALKPWILGSRTGWAKKDGAEQERRLRLHYVAMTRPTHLICLAMKRSSFSSADGELDERQLMMLRNRGWHVENIS